MWMVCRAHTGRLALGQRRREYPGALGAAKRQGGAILIDARHEARICGARPWIEISSRDCACVEVGGESYPAVDETLIPELQEGRRWCAQGGRADGSGPWESIRLAHYGRKTHQRFSERAIRADPSRRRDGPPVEVETGDLGDSLAEQILAAVGELAPYVKSRIQPARTPHHHRPLSSGSSPPALPRRSAESKSPRSLRHHNHGRRRRIPGEGAQRALSTHQLGP